MRERLRNDLHEVVSRGELFVVYQPQFDLGSDEIVAVEALCRWEHPELGLVMPAVFVPVAEDSGAIGDIGRFVVEQGLADADEWRQAGHSLAISVNVSPIQLASPDFAQDVAKSLIEHAYPPSGLTLEITESLPMPDEEGTVDSLSRMRETGLGISLDDYGTGYSSLAAFESLPVSEVKIDRSLVQNASTEARAHLERIVEMAHERGIRVVAEGVETVAQYEMVRDVGCDRAQGYLLGMPMPKDELEALLS